VQALSRGRLVCIVSLRSVTLPETFIPTKFLERVFSAAQEPLANSSSEHVLWHGSELHEHRLHLRRLQLQLEQVSGHELDDLHGLEGGASCS